MTWSAKVSVFVLLLCVASTARAEDRLSALERELDMYAAEGKTQRIGNGVLALAIGGTLLPAGIVMTKRDDSLVHLIGIGAIVTGAVQFVRLPEFIFASDMERLRIRHQKRKADGLSGDALLAATEQDWKAAAEKKYYVQRFMGIFNLGIGVAAIPVGLAFTLRDQIGHMHHHKQHNVGSTMLGIGVGYIGTAGLLLFTPAAIDRSWRAHAVAFGVAPTAQGASLTASARF